MRLNTINTIMIEEINDKKSVIGAILSQKSYKAKIRVKMRSNRMIKSLNKEEMVFIF